MLTSLMIITATFSQDLESHSLGALVKETSSYTAEQKKSVGIPKRDGLLTVGVFPYSPAAAGKLQPYDIIVAVNNTPTTTIDGLSSLLKSIEPGEPIKVDVLPVKRNNKNRLVWSPSKRLTLTVKTYRDIANSSVKEERDKVTGLTTVNHKDAPDDPRTNDFSLWFHAGPKPGPLMLQVCYESTEWLFVDKIIISKDANPCEIRFPRQWNHDNDAKNIWEWGSVEISKTLIDQLKPLMIQTDVTIRYSGQKFFHDRALTADERSRFLIMLLAYEAKGGELTK